MFLRFACGRCGSCVDRSFDETLESLRATGAFRREKSPALDVVLAVLNESNGSFPCGACGTARGVWEAVDSQDDGADWPTGQTPAKDCVGCGARIAAERVEIFPDVELCAKCAAAPPGSAPKRPSADLLCPRCGGLLATTLRPSGRARYIERCGDCGWKS